MENFAINKTEHGIHIEGFPDAVKVVRIGGEKSRRLAHLTLHRDDLDFALECLENINKMPEQPLVLRQSLWRSAVIHFVKCFGKSRSRFSLHPNKIYKGDAEAPEVFNYFSSLRDKHLVHDENSYVQCPPGAALNRKGMDRKIAKILCLKVRFDTLGQDNYNNLHILVTRARDWVVTQFDELCDQLTSELELKSYDELFAREEVTISKPDTDDVHKTRLGI